MMICVLKNLNVKDVDMGGIPEVRRNQRFVPNVIVLIGTNLE